MRAVGAEQFLRLHAVMTQPRCIVPDETTMITRRTTQRFHLLRPDADQTSQDIYWYTTAVLAKKFGVRLHAVQVLSNHMHEIVTDVRGVLPAFVRERNRALANALKCHRGWAEEVFQRRPASYVRLHGAEAILKEIGYTLANCVEAGLVSHPSEWPGVTVSAHDIGRRTIRVRRPDVYFDPKNPAWPEFATIEITMPSALEKTYGASAVQVLKRAVQRSIERARDSVRKTGRRFASSVRHLTSIPFSRRSQSAEPRGQRNPTFATAGKKALAAEAIAQRRAFAARYRGALEALSNVRNVSFPAGAWRWRQELLRPRATASTPTATATSSYTRCPPSVTAAYHLRDSAIGRGGSDSGAPCRSTA